MKKRFLSLLCVLALCLSLLPVTALAADGGTVYVGGVTLRGSTDSPAYATTDDNGTVTIVDASADKYNIKWDGSTLTLNGAKIKGADSSESLYATVGIYAFSNSGDVSLNIALKGVNEIFESSDGIWVYSSSYNAGAVTLTIEGEGSLNASGSSSGILVQSNNGNATLTIQNAEVTATSTVGVGVQVRSGAQKSASLTVDGGSLTATGMSEYGAGIRYTFGSSSFGSGKPSLTVSGNAMVKASGGEGGISDNSSTDIQIGVGDNSSGGIVFDGNKGTVYGDVTLQEDLTIESGQTLDIPSGASLNTDGKLTVDGGTLTQNGTVAGGVTYKVTKVELDKTSLTLDVGKSETLTATITPSNATNQNVTWSSDNQNVATVNQNGEVTAVSAGDATIKVTTEDGEFEATCSVTVNSAATVPVESVSLDKTSLGLTEGETAQLTATVEPEDASNKNVTWESSNTSVATVDANGEVTAVSAGTATITVTTVDGGKTDTCTVTVREEAPDRPVNLPDTHSIDLIVCEGGKARLSLTNASAGSTITVTATPDAGYELDYITVDGERIDGTTFTMPNHDVTVRVYFTDGAALPFTDVSAGAWYYDAVGYAYVGGIMDGVSDTLFDPDGTMTRAMVWAILARVDGETVTGEDWIETAREWAVAEGVSDGENATDYVTREQFATMLWRYASGKGYDVSIGEDTNILSYDDFADLSEYAIPAMQWACGAGVITGVTDATLVPQGEATRAQCAAMLMRFVEAIG